MRAQEIEPNIGPDRTTIGLRIASMQQRYDLMRVQMLWESLTEEERAEKIEKIRHRVGGLALEM